MDSAGEMTKAEAIGIIARLVIYGSLTYCCLKYVNDMLDPTNQQKKEASKRARELLTKIGIKGIKTLNDYELIIAAQLIDPQSIDVTWDHIGGLDKVIDDIKSEVILPMKLPNIFGDNLRPPTGVLLHGPPGCGKTMLAKATAKEAGARFINLEVAQLTDKWYGESQKIAKAVFTLAKKIQPCIIFIDEIDSFLRSRDSYDHEATAMIKAQFMTLWDGLDTDKNSQVIILGATNRPKDVDRAFLRRMPTMYKIDPPNVQMRKEILATMIEPGSLDPSVDIDSIARKTQDFSGSDLRELQRAASMIRVKEYARYHPELFGLATNQSPSPTSSTDNFSIINGGNGDDHLRRITMDDYNKIFKRMLESREQMKYGMEINIDLD